MDLPGLSEIDDHKEGSEYLKINKQFASKYQVAKQKQELDALKQKYGADGDGDKNESSSTSESEDEDAEEVTPKIELQFLKTLSMLQKKDPKIYNKDAMFFEESDSPSEDEEQSTKKSTKLKKKITVKDHERQRLLEKGVKAFVSDSEEESANEEHGRTNAGKTYVEEQEDIKKSFSKAVHEFEADESGDLLQKREKTKEEKANEETEYKNWLKNKKQKSKSENSSLDALHRYWSDPALDKSEKFLRDYILGRKYIDKDSNILPGYDEIVQNNDPSEDEEENNLEKQDEFERKFNFRYEEPDEEFIKSYPRTIKGSVRRQDDKRAKKRKERDARKEEEKEKKRQELKQLKNLKRKEIMEKIEKLKEITGNASVGFIEEDIDGDFDPKKYDELMQKVFNEDYYVEEEEEKPEVANDEEEGYEDEQWDSWSGNYQEDGRYDDATDVHCDDADFNMDADYDPSAEENKLSKRQKRKSRLAKALTKKKPVYNPDEKSFEEYFDEYYKLDYEDIIGDMPVRFKYREVAPNSFGLSTTEILNCEDAELNKWCSIKRAIRYSTKEEERAERRKFNKKGRDLSHKLQILSSLKEEDEEGNTPSKHLKKQRKGKIGVTSKALLRKQQFMRGKLPTGRVDKAAKRAKYNILRKLKDEQKKRSSTIPADRLAAYGLDKKKKMK